MSRSLLWAATLALVPSTQSAAAPAAVVAHVRIAVSRLTPRACVQLKVPSLESKSFKGTIQGFDGLTVVKFYAPWCGTCRRIAPIYERLATKLEEQYSGRIQLHEVNFKENKDLCLREHVYQLPSVHFYMKDIGRVNRFTLSAAIAAQRLAAECDRFLGESDHLQLLQSLQADSMSPMVKYVDLANVVNAIADSKKLLKVGDSATGVIADSVRNNVEQIEKLDRLFASIDTDGNGVLDADEIAAVMRAVGGAKELELEEPLDRNAFIKLMTSKAINDFSTPEKGLMSAFEAIDSDGDGMLTREEVLNAMERLPDQDNQGLLQECEQLFDALDVDKSGTLDYEEFVAMMSGAQLENVYD